MLGRHPLSREVRLVRSDRALALLVPTLAARCPTLWADRRASCLPSAPMPALAVVDLHPSELLPQCSSTSGLAAVQARNWRLWIWIVRLPRLRPCCSSTHRNLIRTKPSFRRHPRWLGLLARGSPKATVVLVAPRLVCPRRETRTPHALVRTTLPLRKATLATPTAKAGSATRQGVSANAMYENARTATGAAAQGSRAHRSESRSRYSISNRVHRIASILVVARLHPSTLAMILVVVRRPRWSARWKVVRRTCQRRPPLVLRMGTGIASASAAKRPLGNIRPLPREMHLPLRVRAVMIPGWILIPNHPGVSFGQRIKPTLLHTQPTARGTMRPLMAALPGVAIVDPSSPLTDPRALFPLAALHVPSLRARRLVDAGLPSLLHHRTRRRRAKRRSASRQPSAVGARAVWSKTAKCRPPHPALLGRHPYPKPQHSRSISDKTHCLLPLCRHLIILARSLDRTDRVARVARLVPIWAHHVEMSMRIMTKV